MPAAQSGMRGGGVRLNVARKYLAVTGANDMVCSGASLDSSFATCLKFCPSSLASRFISGGDIREINCSISLGLLVTKVMARMLCGWGNSY